MDNSNLKPDPPSISGPSVVRAMPVNVNTTKPSPTPVISAVPSPANLKPIPANIPSAGSIVPHIQTGTNPNMGRNVTTGPSPMMSTNTATATNAPLSNWELYRKRFLNTDLSVGLKAAQELRERIELVHSMEYPSFLKHLLEPFTTLLTIRTRPNPNADSVENNIRRTILEILSRFPHNEVLKPHTLLLLYASMDVLKRDYEENALIASRIVFDLHKAYRPMLVDHVQPFLDFVQSSYKELPISVKTNFVVSKNNNPIKIGNTTTATAAQFRPNDPPAMIGSPTLTPSATPVSSVPPASISSSVPPPAPISSAASSAVDKTYQKLISNTANVSQPQQQQFQQQSKSNSPDPSMKTSSQQKQTPLYGSAPLKSISSFRVLNECPLTVMLLFQLYPRFISSNIPTLIPLMMDSLSLSSPPPPSLHHHRQMQVQRQQQQQPMQNQQQQQQMQPRAHQQQQKMAPLPPTQQQTQRQMPLPQQRQPFPHPQRQMPLPQQPQQQQQQSLSQQPQPQQQMPLLQPPRQQPLQPQQLQQKIPMPQQPPQQQPLQLQQSPQQPQQQQQQSPQQQPPQQQQPQPQPQPPLQTQQQLQSQQQPQPQTQQEMPLSQPQPQLQPQQQTHPQQSVQAPQQQAQPQPQQQQTQIPIQMQPKPQQQMPLPQQQKQQTPMQIQPRPQQQMPLPQQTQQQPQQAQQQKLQTQQQQAQTPMQMQPKPQQQQQKKIQSEQQEMFQQQQRVYYVRSRELVACQVKTLSFLTYLLRGFTEQMKPYEDRIANSVVKLMKTCPADSITTRKELLVATRHILAIEHFRRGFYRHVDTMLDERVLFGTHRHTEQSILRPLGYSTLADLVHHARAKLSILQMPRIVLIFSRVIHDPSLPVAIQTTSVRLLLNLLDHVLKNTETNAQGRRDLLVRIFDTLVHKFDSLRNYIPLVEKAAKRKLEKEIEFEKGCIGQLPLEDRSRFEATEESEPLTEETDKSCTKLSDRPHALGGTADVKDSIQDIQSLIKPMISGLKTVIWCLGSSRSQVNSTSLTSPPHASTMMMDDVKVIKQKLTQPELDLVSKYMEWGLACMYVFKLDSDVVLKGSTSSSSSSSSRQGTLGSEKAGGTNKAEKDISAEFFERFAASFTVLDGFSLRRAIGPQIPLIFDSILNDEALITIPHHLISNREVSNDFFDVLLRFFIGRMKYLAVPYDENKTPSPIDSSKNTGEIDSSNADSSERKKASVLLRLFKIMLQSLSLYPENEAVLRPQLQIIVATCLRSATENTSAWPGHYYSVLRVLFRAISVGKFEKSYKELLPLLPTILNGFWRIHCATSDISMKNTIVELSLTTPARLSSLLPHVPLLLRLIVNALKSQHGDLINLGLRTMQFWVENLNPKFLHPILSQDNDIFTELMVSLCSHLRPAPYPYGLISLRLLGKLGGSNREFLREPINSDTHDEESNCPSTFNLICSWNESNESPLDAQEDSKDQAMTDMTGTKVEDENNDDHNVKVDSGQIFTLPLDKSIETAVETLRRVSNAPSLTASERPPVSDRESECDEEYSLLSIGKTESSIPKNTHSTLNCPLTCDEVLSKKIEMVDFTAYAIRVMEETKKDQADSAFTVLRGALAGLIDFSAVNQVVTVVNKPSDPSDEPEKMVEEEESIKDSVYIGSEESQKKIDSTIRNIFCGLIYSVPHEHLHEEAMTLLKGLSTHMLLIFASHTDDISRIDYSGNVVNQLPYNPYTEESGKPAATINIISDSGRLQPLGPFGTFRLTGNLKNKANPLIFNEAIVDSLTENVASQSIIVDIILHMVETSKIFNGENHDDNLEKKFELAPGCSLFFENLLSSLCQSCFSLEWNLRFGVYKALYTLCCALGPEWTRIYEIEILHTVLFSLNDSLKEISCATSESLLLLFRILAFCHGSPEDWKTDSPIIYDLLSSAPSGDKSEDDFNTPNSSVQVSSTILSDDGQPISTNSEPNLSPNPPDAVIQMLVSELVSPCHAVRFGVRHCLRQICTTISERKIYGMEEMLTGYSSLMKRLLLSRSVRTLPLPEQVAIVDALAFVVQETPSLIPLTDQRFLETLSELLKMAAVADGVIIEKKIDPASKGIYIDKNGHAVSVTGDIEILNNNKMKTGPVTHASSIFLRTEYILDQNATGGIGKICVPAELALGIQLRLSSLLLFRAVIRRHTDAFFDAASSTPIGNIRPHVIALLFRSLISQHSATVDCAYAALKDVPFFNTSRAETETNQESHRRLPKDLVQTCIRPVLLDLRDYKKLTISLLRGLSRLLSLLSDWFNKSLGDKLLDHLHRWTEPEKIIDLRIFREGEEPLVAAAIIDIFRMLPHHPPQTPHFVELVIEKTIHLESVLPRFKSCSIATRSPYRTPLARYLNRYCEVAADFFLHEKRLSNLSYSELFQDILKFEESSNLRTYISQKDCTLKLLNVCFERPLAIIRAEKTNKIKMERSEILKLHGINESSSVTHRQMDLGNHNKSSDLANDKNRPVPMTSDSLELQYQGLRLIETLLTFDKTYLKGSNHSDVLMRYRWLWRAKGRYLRLLHEDCLPARYQAESKLIALFLMAYVEANPNEIDILFELLRIFLQPTAVDFSFVNRFIEYMVTQVLSKELKHKVLMRFFDVLTSEGTEETKVLSIELIVLPILSIGSNKKIEHHKSYWEPTKGSWITELPESEGKFLEGKHLLRKIQENETPQQETVVDTQFVRRFMKDALLKGTSSRGYGDRLQTELLKVSTLLIENFRDGMVEHRKDLIKFAWNHLKAEDSGSKYWAYVNVSRFISVYDTPSKIILQVYVALLRATQPESKHLVRTSLDILVPCLPRRLPKDDFESGIKWTKRIVYEENHSIPQLSHIWNTVARHPQVFYFYRHEFIPLMVNSLNRLGLTQTCSLETRTLSIALVDVIISWEERTNNFSETELIDGKRRKVTEDLSSSKKRKLDDESRSSQDNECHKQSTSNTGEKTRSLNQSMVDIIANFLVRICLLACDMNVESGHPRLGQLSIGLFSRLMKQWGNSTELHNAYFDKVFSSCAKEPDFDQYSKLSSFIDNSADRDNALKGIKGSKKNIPQKLGSAGKVDSIKSGSEKSASKDGSISIASILTCLDLFITLLDFAPRNSFFNSIELKMKDFVKACFSRSMKRGGTVIRKKLKRFVYLLISKYKIQTHQINLFQTVKSYIEAIIFGAAKEEDGYSLTSGTGKSGDSPENQKKDRKMSNENNDDDQFEVGRVGGRCSAYFILQLIENVSRIDENITEHFTLGMLSLAQQITRRLTKLKTSGSQLRRSGRQEVLATPTISIMEEACEHGFRFSSNHMARNSYKKPSKNTGVKEVLEPGSAIRSLIICLRMLSASRVPYSFTQHRKDFFQILSTILESCDNVPLLMAAVGIVGTWMSNGGGPMTMKERKSFIWKITDIRCLPEVPAQALVDVVSRMILSLHENESNTLGNSQSNSGGEKIFSPTILDDQIMDVDSINHSIDGNSYLLKSLVASLLSANPSLRSQLVDTVGASYMKKKDGRYTERPSTNPTQLLWQLIYCDWEGIGDRFWIVSFVEVFFAAIKQDGGIQLIEGINVAKKGFSKHSNASEKLSFMFVNPNRTSNDENKGLGENEQIFDVEKFEDFKNFRILLQKEVTGSRSGLGKLLAAMKNLAHGDLDLCEDLFQSILRNVWNQLPNYDVQMAFGPALESLLSQPYHSQFLYESSLLPKFTKMSMRPKRSHTNVIQVWLRAIQKLTPLPFFNIDLLVPLASTFNTWHETIEILQRQYLAIESCEDYSFLKDKVFHALRKCYDHIGEKEISLALMINPSEMTETKRAISLDIYGHVEEALTCFKHLVDEVDNDSSWALPPSETELSFWEERWIELNKELCQWGVLSDYAKATGSPNLMVESAWKSRDWQKLRKLCVSPSVIADLERGDPLIKITEIFLAIADGKLNDVEHLHAQTAQLCLHQWQLLPKVSSACMAHNSLLQTFHRLVELRESGQIMVEISKHAKNRTFPDLKNLLSTWKDRLPNDYESLSVWEDLFLWRNHMFSAITSSFHWSEPGTLATLHDRPWTSIRMAKTARKHGMKEVAFTSLNMLTDCAMDVSDAFLKLREQILGYMNPDSQLERKGGLNLVNTTNLSYFDSAQKSELFRLKASFLSSLGQRGKANQAYCHAVRVCPTYWKAWVEWGTLCSSLADFAEYPDKNNPDNNSSSSDKKVAQYLAQAMGCFFEAIQCNANRKTTMHIPRCLWMLRKDAHTPGVLCQTLKDRGSPLPEWVWLPWLPQLLTSLSRVESKAMKSILNGICLRYPQAVYYSLRAFYLERRDVERAQKTQPSDPNRQNNAPTAVSHAESLMSELRKTHPTLWSNLEAILEELILRFRPTFEEELLVPITTLLGRASRQQSQQEGAESFIASFSKTIQKVSSKLFRPPATPNIAGVNVIDIRVKKASEFCVRYKAAFEKDFCIGNETDSSNLTLPTIIENLKKWKKILHNRVSASVGTHSLAQISTQLSRISYQVPDLWQGSCDSLVRKDPSSRRRNESKSANASDSSVAEAYTAAETVASAVAAFAAFEGGGGHFGGGSEAIEIPGRYPPNSTYCIGSKPSVELHAKLLRFDSSVEIIWKNHGQQLVRRIGMVGSDGKTHHFLLQFSIPYMARTDERAAQLHYLLSTLLSSGHMALKRNLNVRSTAIVPIASRIRMTGDDCSNTSLDSIYLLDKNNRDKNNESPVAFFQSEVTKRLAAARDTTDGGGNTQPSTPSNMTEKTVKLEVFNEICATMVKSDILLRHIQAKLKDPEALFLFRKAFCGQLAISSLLQFAFSILDRSPGNFVFSAKSARVFTPDFKFAYNNQGLLEANRIPFRMTRNIQTLLGPNSVMMDGALIPGICSVASSIWDHKDEIDSVLRLLLRDDMISWYTSKSMARSDTETQELERQFADRISKNVSLVRGRIEDCVPKVSSKSEEDSMVDAKVRSLIDLASGPETLCMAPVNFQGWL